MSVKSGKSLPKLIIATLVLVFGLITLAEGSSTLLRHSMDELAQKQIVPFILIFNVLSGLVYLAVFWGILKDRNWTKTLASFLTVAVATAFLFLGLHIYHGEPYLTRTVYVMTIRLVFWVLTTFWLWRREQR